jgi:membrane protein DedA with SNARE-associated domain
LKQFIAHLITWYQGALDSGGYVLVAALMAIESTVLPVPSELVIPFAAQRAHATGKFSVVGIVIAGTIGSWVGATIMYWASRLAGRPFVMKYGGYFLVPEPKVHAAERWAERFGSFGVFVARLLPVVRHLIGIPMGIVKMDFKLYSLFTLLGSAIWCTILAWVGIKFGEDEMAMKGDLHRLTLWVVGFVVVIGVIYYFFVHRHMRNPTSTSSNQDKQK